MGQVNMKTLQRWAKYVWNLNKCELCTYANEANIGQLHIETKQGRARYIQRLSNYWLGTWKLSKEELVNMETKQGLSRKLSNDGLGTYGNREWMGQVQMETKQG